MVFDTLQSLPQRLQRGLLSSGVGLQFLTPLELMCRLLMRFNCLLVCLFRRSCRFLESRLLSQLFGSRLIDLV